MRASHTIPSSESEDSEDSADDDDEDEDDDKMDLDEPERKRQKVSAHRRGAGWLTKVPIADLLALNLRVSAASSSGHSITKAKTKQ